MTASQCDFVDSLDRYLKVITTVKTFILLSHKPVLMASSQKDHGSWQRVSTMT
jgi:hypothetical protein